MCGGGAGGAGGGGAGGAGGAGASAGAGGAGGSARTNCRTAGVSRKGNHVVWGDGNHGETVVRPAPAPAAPAAPAAPLRIAPPGAQQAPNASLLESGGPPNA